MLFFSVRSVTSKGALCEYQIKQASLLRLSGQIHTNDVKMVALASILKSKVGFVLS